MDTLALRISRTPRKESIVSHSLLLITISSHYYYYYLLTPSPQAYSFLNPKKQGKKLAIYIVGIAIGQVIIFCIVVGILHLRKRLTERRSQPEAHGEKLPENVEA